MISRLPRALFVTGTDTDCGKTLVASAVIHAYRNLGFSVLGMKPVASGSTMRDGHLVNDDVVSLINAANVSGPPEIVNPYIFEPAISPHFAARQSGIEISKEKILEAFNACQALADIVIVEGAGGWRVPLGEQLDIAGLASALDIPILIVSGLRLGCINHTILTCNDIRATGCKTIGWVANLIDKNYDLVAPTIATIQAAVEIPLVANIPWKTEQSAAQVASAIDLAQLART